VPQDLLVFVQNVIRYKPDEIAFLGPFVQQIGASLSSSRRMLRVEQLLQNQLTQSPSLHYIDG
jgi:hypothetical protein